MLQRTRETVASRLRQWSEIASERNLAPVGRVAKEIADRIGPMDEPAVEAVAETPTETPAAPTVRPTEAGVIGPEALRDRMAAEDAPIVVDIREPREWSKGVIEGARTIVVTDLLISLGPIAEEQRPVVLYCGNGSRADYAARHFIDREIPVQRLEGGLDAWTDAGLPIIDPPAKS